MERSQIWLTFVAVALLLVSALADDVVVLTEENFEKEVGQDRGALVEFYAPWYNLSLYLKLTYDSRSYMMIAIAIWICNFSRFLVKNLTVEVSNRLYYLYRSRKLVPYILISLCCTSSVVSCLWMSIFLKVNRYETRFLW